MLDYICLQVLEHDQRRYLPGYTIALDDAAAVALIEAGAIALPLPVDLGPLPVGPVPVPVEEVLRVPVLPVPVEAVVDEASSTSTETDAARRKR